MDRAEAEQILREHDPKGDPPTCVVCIDPEVETWAWFPCGARRLAEALLRAWDVLDDEPNWNGPIVNREVRWLASDVRAALFGLDAAPARDAHEFVPHHSDWYLPRCTICRMFAAHSIHRRES